MNFSFQARERRTWETKFNARVRIPQEAETPGKERLFCESGNTVRKSAGSRARVKTWKASCVRNGFQLWLEANSGVNNDKQGQLCREAGLPGWGDETFEGGNPVGVSPVKTGQGRARNETSGGLENPKAQRSQVR